MVSIAKGEEHPEEFQKFETGALRQRGDSTRYDLISPHGLRRLAETYGEGARKYGDNNWRKGFPWSDILNHLMRHIEAYRTGDRSEDHLAHAAWGLFALMEFEETHSELNDLIGGYHEPQSSNHPIPG